MAPPEGVEVNTYALTTNVYRANNTLESFSYEGIKLYGCERDGIERERSWFERLLDATPDALSDVWGVAPPLSRSITCQTRFEWK